MLKSYDKEHMTTGPGRTVPAGIAYMCAGVFCISVNDALAKWLGEFYPVGQIVFFRMLFALPLLMVLGWLADGRRALVTSRPLFHIVRGLLAAGATFFFFIALTLLPLAESS